MTDIRKAVELADGVYLDEYSHLIGMGSAVFIDDLQQYHLDALAAQLERQYWPLYAAMKPYDRRDLPRLFRIGTSATDRIQAIVDSGVLE